MCGIYRGVAATDRLLRCTGFDWDEANAPKIWKKHKVSPMECEQVFFNLPLIAGHDEGHSGAEMRYYVLGQSDPGRRLFVVVTVRRGSLRVISARDMSRKERKAFESS
ncbi:MAG: BrnT family toxin [Planctomycetota bacterium]|nr:MAG: BrnT family toxin [Planctomycetota bacterium]